MTDTGYFRAMVVDDEPIILRNLIKKIEECDARVRVTSSADNAEDALRLMRDAFPDILFADICMAGMDGLQLARRVKELRPETAVVVVSGHDSFSYAVEALRCGADDYLLKPVEKQMLSSTINKIVRRFESVVPGEPEPSIEAGMPLPDKIKLYLELNYRENITLSTLSSIFHFNPSYMNRVFKRAHQLSPIQYLIGFRIRCAKEILCANPSLEIKDVAYSVGYDDPHYFSRVFKQETGVAPSDWGKV